MTSQLPPREIQSRIRAGETPEDVATAAQTTLEKVLVYAGPVLAERAHLAGLAQAASVRTPGGTSAGVLSDLVETRLRASALDASAVNWDAWRRPDRTWAVVAELPLDGVARTATFTHDIAGRYVVAEDDLARWLTGELDHRPGLARTTADDAAPGDGDSPAPQSSADGEIPLPPAPAEQTLRAVRDGDLSGPPAEVAPASGVDAPAQIPDPAETPEAPEASDDDQLALGDDAIAMVTGGQAAPATPRASTSPATGSATGWRDDVDAPSWLEQPGPEPTPAPAPAPTPDPAPEPTQDVLFGEPADASQDAPAAKPGRRRGRAAIPSWDEIMFGGPTEGAPLAEGTPDAQVDEQVDDREDERRD
ncbi:DUF3071 domain-containing protein [Nocardioidaceae bacterium]|nr:DUF3071 domain-containing protein [Nocardioidaceae bacterium]